MDINMPLLNGIEATSILMELIKEEKIEKPIIIACSSYADETTRD
jgi:CheY-like chemotaxis protein